MAAEVVVVTGGSSGIGLAAAHRFARQGARVVLVARDPERLERARAEVGGNALALSADLTSPEAVATLAESLARDLGRVDVLVNSAGQLELGPAEELGPETAERLMRVNYLGPVRTTLACLPLLRRGERRSIVNVASVAGKIAPPFMGAYAASKAALTAYTYSLRQELRPEGFQVALVSPGPVDTPMTQGRLHTRHYPLPPGTVVVSADQAADAVLAVVERRRAEVVVPLRLGFAARLGQLFPSLVDAVYRRTAEPEIIDNSPDSI
ncbi:MAG TPA: SDR family NAD(P)-dependent oxidoreductase [Longimicrobiaceae bacterium]|nr:SDR family NAD(P)-dependent oxidoreductase [Longimicrobiaceae bacterium]